MAGLLGYPSHTYNLHSLMSRDEPGFASQQTMSSYSPVASADSSPSPPARQAGYGGSGSSGGSVGVGGVGGAAPPRRRRRARTLFDEGALNCLEAAFTRDRYPDIHRREELANQIGVPEARVQTWFQNKRSRMRRDSRQKMSPGEFSQDGREVFPGLPSRDKSLPQSRKMSPEVGNRSSSDEQLVIDTSPRSDGDEDDRTPPTGPRRKQHHQMSRRYANRSSDEGLGSLPSTPDRANWTPGTGYYPFPSFYAPKMNLAEGRSYLEPVPGLFQLPVDGLSSPGMPFSSYLAAAQCISPAQLVPSLQLPVVPSSHWTRFPPTYQGATQQNTTAVQSPPSSGNHTNQRRQGDIFRPVDFSRLSHSEDEDATRQENDASNETGALDLRVSPASRLTPVSQSSPRSATPVFDQQDSGDILNGSPPSSGYLSDEIDVCN